MTPAARNKLKPSFVIHRRKPEGAKKPEAEELPTGTKAMLRRVRAQRGRA